MNPADCGAVSIATAAGVAFLALWIGAAIGFFAAALCRVAAHPDHSSEGK